MRWGALAAFRVNRGRSGERVAVLSSTTEEAHRDRQSHRGDAGQGGHGHGSHLFCGRTLFSASRPGDSVPAVDLLERPEELLRISTGIRVVPKDSLPSVSFVRGDVPRFASAVHDVISSGGVRTFPLDATEMCGPRNADAAGTPRPPGGADFALVANVLHTGQVARTRRLSRMGPMGPARSRVGRASTTGAGERSPAAKVGGRHARPRGRVVIRQQRQRIGPPSSSPPVRDAALRPLEVL